LNKSSLAFLVLLPLLFLGGCWSSVEINDRAFVRMIILDKTKEGIELTLGLPLPSRLIPGQAGGTGAQNGKPYTYVTKTGSTIGEAYRFIQSDLSRKITFGQTSVVVIGSNLAKEGIQPILEFIAREPRFHINSNLYVIQGKALDLTLAPTILERFPTEIFLNYNKQNIIVETTTNDALMAAYYGGDLILPLLKMEKKSIPSEKGQNLWLQTAGGAFFKQGRLVGSMGIHQMRGALWILGQLDTAVITVKSEKANKYVNYMVKGLNTRIEPIVDGDQITVVIHTKAAASLISSVSDIDPVDPREQKRMEKRLEAKVNESIIRAIELARKVDSDAYQISSHLDWKHPKLWKEKASQWREIYRNQITFLPQADISIKRVGAIKQPVRMHSVETEGD